MDVEAQEDGVLAKIMQPDGSKSIKVGARIAVVAESGDDLQSLEMPADEAPKSGATAESESASKEQSSSNNTQESTLPSKDKSEALAHTSHVSQKYPLYPSVQALLRESGLSDEDARKIPASGPNGRLLKGDVLSYIGKISRDYSSVQSSRINNLGHLDLSNIQRAEPKPPSKPPPPPPTKPAPEPEPDTQIAVSISLAAVLATQKRMTDTLGITLPLSTFIARASQIANSHLPRAKGAAPTMDELYDAVLGLDQVAKTSHGTYVPQVTALAPVGVADAVSPPRRKQREDIIDILSGPSTPKSRNAGRKAPSASDAASTDSTNVFSVLARSGEEQRARTYLERVKTVLEAEPGRCVL